MSKSKFKKRHLALYLMVLPGCIYLFINNYLPLTGLILAFKKFSYQKGIWGSAFIGLENFKFLFKGKDIWLAIRNTLIYNAWFIVLGNILAVTVAIMLNSVKSKRKKKVYQTVIMIPYLISMVIVSYMVYAFFSQDNGFVNEFLRNTLHTDGKAWYVTPQYWPFILTFVYLWKSFGYNSIIYYATVIGIDPSLYEAAKMDGATNWQQAKYVTLPCLRSTIIIIVLLSIGKVFYSDFGLFYQVPMNSGPLINATSTIDTYVYRALLTLNDVGRSSAGGFLQSICGFVLVMLANHVVTKLDSDSALL